MAGEAARGGLERPFRWLEGCVGLEGYVGVVSSGSR